MATSNESITITYDGKTIATLTEGQAVTLHTKGKKAKTDIVVNVSEAIDDINLISFTIHNESDIAYQAVEGMTWAEWCESEYNTGYSGNGYADELYAASNYVCAWGNAYITDGGGLSNRVKPTDIIKKDYSYVIYFD